MAESDQGRIAVLQLLLLLLLLVFSISNACFAPLPKPLNREQCGCYHNGSNAYMTCYSDVECYGDMNYIYHPVWSGYFDNGEFHNFTYAPRYNSTMYSEKRGKDLTRFTTTLSILDVTDADYMRKFRFLIITEYEGMEQLAPFQLCNKTERRTVDIDELVDTPLLAICLPVAFVVFCCGVIGCAVINQPCLKYQFLKYCKREILLKRKDTKTLKHDTVLLYDTDDAEAERIALCLKNELTSRALDVASADDVIPGQLEISNLCKPIPDSATVIYIITPESTTDGLLTVARNVVATCKTSKEQIVVYTDKKPLEFKQYKLLNLSWFEDVRKKKHSRPSERYNSVPTGYTDRENGGEPNGISCEYVENSSDDEGNNQNSKGLIQRWKSWKFYLALELGLSKGFGTSEAASKSSENSLTDCQPSHVGSLV